MASFDLSRASGSGTAKFEGFVEYELNDLNEERAKYEVRLYACLSAGYTYATLDGKISDQNGTITSGTWGGESSSVLDTEPVLVCSGYFRIYFNGSSTASGTLSASVKIRNSGSFSSNPTISGSKKISANAPEPEVTASTITLGASTVQMGKQLLISIDADDDSCTHTLKYSFCGVSDTIASNVGSSYAWTVPELANQCYGKLSEICTITCITYLNGVMLGESTATVTLTVPDPAVPEITGGEITLGSVCSILCKRNSTAFKVDLSFTFKKTSVTISENYWADSKNWTPGYDLAKQIPNLISGTGTLVCKTWSGTALVGTKEATIRVIVPENDVTRPKFTADGLVLTPVSSLPEAFAGLYMRGKTGLTAAFTASSDYSTVTEYAVTVGNQSAAGNPAVIDLLISEGDVKVTGKVTDARGFSTSVSTTIPILPYRIPKVTPYTGYADVICERAKDTGELSPDGTYLAIKAGKSFSSVVLDGTEKNSCQLRYRWKPNGADAYTDWITLLAEGSAETEISLLVGNVVSSLQTSYMVEIEAVDALDGRHKLSFQIMTEAISFVLYDGPDGAGFGKYPEAPHVVDIASHMTLLVRGKMRVLGDEWVSIGLMEALSESAYEHGRKEAGCHYLVTEGRHVHIAFNCGFGYAGTAIVINATPIPEDNRPARPVFSLCPANDRQIACVSVGTDGYILVEWVQKATDSVLTGNTDVTWLDGYLCYWT